MFIGLGLMFLCWVILKGNVKFEFAGTLLVKRALMLFNEILSFTPKRRRKELEPSMFIFKLDICLPKIYRGEFVEACNEMSKHSTRLQALLRPLKSNEDKEEWSKLCERDRTKSAAFTTFFHIQSYNQQTRFYLEPLNLS